MNEIENLFQNYSVEAFRLESLSEYKIAGERENYLHYLKSGEVIQDPELVTYLIDVKNKITQGAMHKRVRVLETPIKQYQIFETKVGYIPSYKLGTKFYFINRPQFEQIFALYHKSKTYQDIWIFDNQKLAVFQYDKEGPWVGG